MKFFYVYILQNVSKSFTYIGYSENLKERFKKHNKGFVQSTKHYIPLQLVHYEAYRSLVDAKRRESYLKTNKGRRTLITMLKDFIDKNSR